MQDKSWGKLLELHEMMFTLFKKNFPESDELDEFENLRLELENQVEGLKDREPDDQITESVVRKIVNRSKIGAITYGYSMEREDMTREQWLQELSSELTDAAIYCEKLLELERAKQH